MTTLAKQNEQQTFNFNPGKRCIVTLGPSGRIKVAFTISGNGTSIDVDLDMLSGHKSAEGKSSVTQVTVTNTDKNPSTFTVVSI